MLLYFSSYPAAGIHKLKLLFIGDIYMIKPTSTNNFVYKSILMSSLLCVTLCSADDAVSCDVNYQRSLFLCLE